MQNQQETEEKPPPTPRPANVFLDWKNSLRQQSTQHTSGRTQRNIPTNFSNTGRK